MRRLLISMSAIALLSAGPALAQTPQDQPAKGSTASGSKADTGSATSASDTAPTMDQCKAMKDKKASASATSADKAEWAKHSKACVDMMKKPADHKY